jgi:CubicO group peptidase (beta-lactamase class C family)
MRMRSWHGAALLATALAAGIAQALPDDAAVRAILEQRIEQKQGVGFAVVLVDRAGTRIVTAGRANAAGAPITADSEFEIGSITKTFTSLLLADAVLRDAVKLDQPVSQLLPAEWPPLARDGTPVTLQQLASHTSGLPPLPDNFKPANPDDPYVDYDATRLLAFLSGTPLQRVPGERYRYSNLGGGLLGYALTRGSGGYEATLRTRVLVPLDMNDTAISLSPTQSARLAMGHRNDLSAAANWNIGPTLVGAGGLRSTANDMARYLRAAAGWDTTPLAAAFKLAETPVAEAGVPIMKVGLGWHIRQSDGKTVVWHNGRTGGYASILLFDPEAHEGVVVLSNASISVDDLGAHLLDPSRKLAEPPRERVAVKVAPALYDRIAGRYELAPGFVVTVRRDGDRLFAQATGQPRFEIFPESEYEYFYKVVDAQLSFQRDSAGGVTGVVLHQGGRAMPGKRLD